MKLQGIHVEPVHYELRAPLRTTLGEIFARIGFRIRLRDESGAEGFGETLPLPEAGTEELSDTGRAIADVATLCSGHTYGLSGLLDLLEERLPHAPAARCAFDVAAHELEAAVRGTQITSLLGEPQLDSVRVVAMISASDPAKSVDEAVTAVGHGYRTLELRVGLDPADDDVDRVRAVRAAVGPEVRIRIDAGGAWSYRTALETLGHLAELDIELVEQPVAADDLDSLRFLHERSPIPVAVAATLAARRGRDAFLRGNLAAIAVVEPMVLGGLRRSLRLAKRATSLGLRACVATTLEGPTTTRAALQLAAVLPDSGLDHRLPGADAISGSFPDALAPQHGLLRVSPA